MSKSISSEVIKSLIESFEKYKSLAEKTVEQISEEEIHFRTDENENSIAIIIQHLNGNLKSRFTEFFTSDGEKSNRNRDAEFEEQNLSKNDLMVNWNNSWKLPLDILYNLKEDDLLKTIKIRGEDHTVIQALQRSLTHAAYHVGQIVQLGKIIKKENWKSLSIPKGKSEEYNKGMLSK